MSRQTAVIVDMDGTLANVDHILHYITTPGQKKDFFRFHEEGAKAPAEQKTLAWCRHQISQGHEIVIVTGRSYQHIDSTTAWLDKNLDFSFRGPFMRGDNDTRHDTEVKKDIYDILVNDYQLDIVAAIDDRPRIVDLWMSLGIPTTVVYRENWEGKETYSPNLNYIEHWHSKFQKARRGKQ